MSTISVISLLLGAAACGSGKESPLAFGLIADCQFASAPAAGNRYYSHSYRKLTESLESFSRDNARFVVHLGDLIDRDARSYDLILPVFGRWGKPVYHVAGNHDFEVADEAKPNVLGLLGLRRGDYAFSEGRWRFIVLDGTELSYYAAPDKDRLQETGELFRRQKNESRINAETWNGGIGRRQVEFLKTELEAAETSGDKVLIFCHFPVFPEDKHNLWNDREVVALIERFSCVKAFFAGHKHDGAYAEQEGIHYLTLKGMVETPDENAYALVILLPERIEIRGFGREPSRSLVIR
jgi:predicted phosphodiesterase